MKKKQQQPLDEKRNDLHLRTESENLRQYNIKTVDIWKTQRDVVMILLFEAKIESAAH